MTAGSSGSSPSARTEKMVRRQSPLPTRLFRGVYGLVVGYGYYPLRAGFWLVMVVIAGSIIVATNRADFVPTRPATASSPVLADAGQAHEPNPAPITGQTPCSAHLQLSVPNAPQLHRVCPVPTFGMGSADWTFRSDATNWLIIALPLLKLMAWALTALLLAGVTGFLGKT
jgi:hypothetical protein